MSGRSETPRPGAWTRFLLARRADASAAHALLDEMAELYEHRVETSGESAARRWLKREYRRLAWRLLFAGRLEGVDPTLPVGGAQTAASFLQDLRHSVRGLGRAPLFTGAIVATVGLGIGGTTLVFAVVDSVLIAPLPYPGSERMVLLRTVDGDQMWSTSMADIHALGETPPPAFDAIAAYTYRTMRVASGAETEMLSTKWVTANYFSMIGREPVLGRDFSAAEAEPGGPRVALVTERFSERSFSSSPVGQSILIDGEPHEIVGVLPNQLGPLDRAVEVYPLLDVVVPGRKGPFFFPTIGRLQQGASPEVARAQLRAVSERIFPIWQASFTQEEAVLGFVDLKGAVVRGFERTLVVVLAAVGFLLLIASANAASLLVARGATRARELSVRTALGASKGRVLRLLLTEALAIAMAAGAVAWLIVFLGLDAVRRFGVGHLPRIEDIGVRPSTLAFFAAVTLLSWLLFGLVAAIGTARAQTTGVAGTQGRSTAGRSMTALRRVLVGAQFAITIPLMVGAGLLVQSLAAVESESFGFDPEGVVSMTVTLPWETFGSGDDVRAFWGDMLPRIEALPTVLSAGLADSRPPTAIQGGNNFQMEDRPTSPGEPQLQAPWITADSAFFGTLGLRLVSGRLYSAIPTDTMRHAVVDESWSERVYPGESPLGRRFRSGGCTIDGCPWTEIVGVVSDVKTAGLDDTRRQGTIYYDFNRDTYSAMALHLRVRGDVADVVPTVRSMIHERDPGIPVSDVRTAADIAADALVVRRYTSTLVGVLAIVALLLTVIGVYGVMAYYVQHHVRDIGIRIALGGGPAGALRGVLASGMIVATIGTLLGLAVTPALTGRMSDLLYGVTPNNPLILGTVAASTLLVALTATLIPGRQAAATDPAKTLRQD